jgi:signal transduction histidine kinase
VENKIKLDGQEELSTLTRLLSGVAHQLRRPLQGIKLRLELLRSDTEERKDLHLDKLREAIDRLDSSIEALDRFANPGELAASRFDLNQLLRESAARVRNDQIRIEFGLAEALPEIFGDRSMISEALANIITNAVEAMPQGGVLRLESRSHDGQAEITVADSGSGIPQDNLARIFELYFTTKPEGRGLGLSLALRGIELNRGSIRVESCAGQGTTCHVALPLARLSAPSTE